MTETHKTFSERVWELTGQVPKGKVTTYGEIARALGRPAAARAVGRALRRNPHAPAVPCHRVVKATGEIGGYAGSEAGKIGQKKRMLRREGVTFNRIRGNRIDLAKYGYRF